MLPVVSILKRNRGVAAAAGAGAGPRTRTRTRSLYSDQVLAQHYANYTDIIEKIRWRISEINQYNLVSYYI